MAEQAAEREAVSLARVWDVLRECYDPEIPVNIVELGLIYDCRIEPAPDGDQAVEVEMTLTSPGCAMAELLKVEIESKLMALDGVDEARVTLVFDPPWDPSRMSEAARLELGLM